MIETHLNIFDVVVLAILLLSCIFAFYRGFVREILSLGAWIGAAIITIYYFPAATEYMRPHFKSAIGAAGVSTLGIYTLSLIGLSIINSIIIKYVKSGNEVGMLDNFLGLVFGAARGAFLISLGYFMITIAIPEKEYPEWLKHSLSRPYVEICAIELVKIAPDYLREISNLEKKVDPNAAHKPKSTLDEELDKESNSPTSSDDSSDSSNKSSSEEENTGYNPNETNKLRQLLDNPQK